MARARSTLGVCCFPLLFAVLLLAGLASAAPWNGVPSQWFPPDARSQGFGRAFTAIAEGPAAAWWNPGALGLQQGADATPYADFPIQPREEAYVLKSYSASGGRDGVGAAVHLSRFKGEEFIATDEQGVPIGRYTPSEYVGILAGGVDLNRRALHGPAGWYLGLGGGLKIFHSRRIPEELALDHKSGIATGWDLDLGSLISYRAPLSILAGPRGSYAEIRGGLVVHNVFARDIAYEAEKDPLGREARAGVALRARFLDLPPFDYLLGATVSAERNWILDPYSAKPGSFYGAEIAFLGLVSIRHGWIRDDDAQTHDTVTGYGMGFDLKLAGDRRVGMRYDIADVPSANELWRTDSQTFTLFARW